MKIGPRQDLAFQPAIAPIDRIRGFPMRDEHDVRVQVHHDRRFRVADHVHRDQRRDVLGERNRDAEVCRGIMEPDRCTLAAIC